MIKIIYGKKGTGKSKMLVDAANKEVEEARGSIVYLDDDSRARYDIKYQIRFIDITHYGIDSQDKLVGFICSILASDYDIHSIYMDGIKKIIEEDLQNTEKFFTDLRAALAASDTEVNFTMIISGDPDKMPEFIREYII